jgi:hypothetical protein
LLVRLLRAAAEADANTESVASRIEALLGRKARFGRRREAYRAAVQQIMEALPTVFPDGKYAGAEYSATIRAGTPKPIVTDENVLPEQFWRVVRSHDMQAIRSALKAGPVPGVTTSNAAPVLIVKGR